MKIKFSKYQGSGNDFIIIDNRLHAYRLTSDQISFLCNRRLGIGADGLIYLEDDCELDFKMIYYNADGKEGSFCGNGARCISAFAKELNLVNNSICFSSYDGIHNAEIEGGVIRLKMSEVLDIKMNKESLFLNTGSPHCVLFVENFDLIDDIVGLGRKIRNKKEYQPDGINVNFVQIIDETSIKIRTYERGVEDETLSCGTGVTASALASCFVKNIKASKIDVYTQGGILSVCFKKTDDGFKDVFLIGPAEKVFEGTVEL